MKVLTRTLLLILVSVLAGCATTRNVRVESAATSQDASVECIEVFDTGPVR